MLTLLALFSILIVAVSILGGVLPLASVFSHTRLQIYLSLSAGIMLGASFFHMLPEAVELGDPGTIRWAILGLLSLFFVERFFSYHQHEPPPHDHGLTDSGSACHHSEGDAHPIGEAISARGNTPNRPHGTALHWTPAAIGLAVHSLMGGIALASAVTAQSALGTSGSGIGWGVFLATAAHKPADALTIVSLMLRAGVPRWLAHLVNLGFALMVPGGIALFFLGIRLVGPDIAASGTAAVLSFSAGTFLCISLSDLLPELQFHSHDRLKLSIALLGGIGLMAAVAAFE
jgi:zinc and cadmium transporter